MSIGIWALCSLARFCRFCLAAASGPRPASPAWWRGFAAGWGTDSSSWAPRCASWRTRARRPFCRRSSRPRCSAWRRRCSAMRTMPTGVGMGAARPLRPWFPRPRFPNRSERRCTYSPWPGRWGRSCCSTRWLAAVRGCRTSPPWPWDIRTRLGTSRRRARRLRRLALSWLPAGPWASWSARLGDRVVVKAVVAGAILGSSRDLPPLYPVRRRGPDRDAARSRWTALGAGVLLATGFLKVLASQVCLGLGWRGGHSFPLIFSGIAIGDRRRRALWHRPGLRALCQHGGPSGRRYAPAANGGLAAHPVLSRESRCLRPCRCVLGRRRSGSEGVLSGLISRPGRRSLSGLILGPDDAPCDRLLVSFLVASYSDRDVSFLWMAFFAVDKIGEL